MSGLFENFIARWLRREWVSLLLFVIAGAMPAFASHADSCQTVADQLATRFRDALNGHPLGVVMAVHCDGQSRVSTYGYRDAEGRALTADTPIYIASVTKSLTGILAGLEQLRGRMPLSKTIAETLSAASDQRLVFENPDVGSRSVGSLLSHTHQLDNAYVTHRLSLTGEYSQLELLYLLRNYTITRAAEDAHTGYRYSNFGYNLYAEILAAATGRNWKQALIQDVLRPLGMVDTHPYVVDDIAPGFQPHSDGRLTELPLAKNDQSMHSAGGLVSTGNDLLRFIEFLAEPENSPHRELQHALAEATRERVSGVPIFGTHHRLGGYGLGFAIDHVGDLDILIGKGSFAGMATFIAAVPEKNIGIAIHVNETINGQEYGQALMAAVTGCLVNGCDVNDKVEQFAALSKPLIARVFAANDRMAEQHAQRQWQLGLPFSEYCGGYHSSRYGLFVIDLRKGQFHLRTGPIDVPLTPYPDSDSARVELVPGRGKILRFDVVDNDVAGLVFADAYFKRVSSKCAG